MKAVVWIKYGAPEVLTIGRVNKPIPKNNEILIKVIATTVTAGDCEARAFKFPPLFWIPLRLLFGIFKPRKIILGQELSGKIVAKGKDVNNFNLGDEIFAPSDMKFGTYAQFKCLPASHPIALKPKNITFEEAATIPTGGLNALYFISKANIKKGDKILIKGAGGSIGTYAIQLLKNSEVEITSLDSKDKLEMLKSIGSNYVIDYTKIDINASEKKYDVIIDIAGKTTILKSLKILNPNGRYILGNPSLSGWIIGIWTNLIGTKKVRNALASYKKKDLDYLKGEVENGRIIPVIDKVYPLEQIADAHQYVENGNKQGNLVLKITH